MARKVRECKKKKLKKPTTRGMPMAQTLTMYFDPDRQYVYNNTLDLPNVPLPNIPYDLEPPSFKEFYVALRRCRNGAIQGPNSIP